MPSFSLRPSDFKRKNRPTSASRQRKLLLSYAPDWFVAQTVCLSLQQLTTTIPTPRILTIALAALFFSLDKVEGYRREFSLQDTSYTLHERVPNVALYLICFIAPLSIQPIINYLTVRSWWDLHNATLGLILSLATTGSITQFVKITVGRPRPDIIDRCKPPAGATDPPFGLTSWTICTQTDNGILRDGFRSFFSGHSSLSFAGLGFLSFYLAGKMHLFDKRGHTGKTWLALSPFSGAALVAISRTMDYRLALHYLDHWQDVLIGSIIGTTLAYFSYRQYYPSLASDLCHRPYSPRIKREDQEILPSHMVPSDDLHSQPFDAPRLPFAGGSGSGYENVGHSYELAGTIPRPELGPMDEIWRGNESSETGVPEPLHQSATHSPHGERRV
ncbi:hypothetical protein AX17_005116 [Amanita inopinata Kibby_2008]|nr:hypothetical protein AX17_005116 [Amanita inopinata Kibby_2008]